MEGPNRMQRLRLVRFVRAMLRCERQEERHGIDMRTRQIETAFRVTNAKEVWMRFVSLGVLVAFAAIATTTEAEDWPSFRGPSGTGVSGDKAAPPRMGGED